MAVRRKKSADVEEVSEVSEYAVEETVESVEEESAPRRRGVKPLTLPALAKDYEKKQRAHERAVNSQAPAQAKVDKARERLAKAEQELADLDGSAVAQAAAEMNEAKAALDAGVAELTA